MKSKKPFVRPSVLQSVDIQLETDLLGTSVEDYARIVSMGQAVENYDLESSDYDVQWD